LSTCGIETDAVSSAKRRCNKFPCQIYLIALFANSSTNQTWNLVMSAKIVQVSFLAAHWTQLSTKLSIACRCASTLMVCAEMVFSIQQTL
jgi:hypothetical protein